QPRAELLHELNLASERQLRAPSNQRGQRLALDVLHRDERLAVEFADVEDGDDVGVMQSSGRLRFAREALPDLRAVGGLAKQLDDDAPVADVRIAGEIEVAHPPVADRLDDLIATDNCRSTLRRCG